MRVLVTRVQTQWFEVPGDDPGAAAAEQATLLAARHDWSAEPATYDARGRVLGGVEEGGGKVALQGVYPLCDPLPAAVRKAVYDAGLMVRGGLLAAACRYKGSWLPRGMDVMARWDGRPPRPPRAGEWFLSGANVEAYLAPSDLGTPYHIATLHVVETSIQTIRRVAMDIPRCHVG